MRSEQPTPTPDPIHTLSLALALTLTLRCVTQACALISEAARRLGGAYRESADHVLPLLLKLSQVTVIVIKESGDACVRTLIREVRAPSLLPPILAAAIGREASAASLRSVCISYTQVRVRVKG